MGGVQKGWDCWRVRRELIQARGSGLIVEWVEVKGVRRRIRREVRMYILRDGPGRVLVVIGEGLG